MLVLRKDLEWNKLTPTQKRIVSSIREREKQLGENNTNAVLSDAQALEIKQRLSQGEEPIAIAEAMKISRNLIDDIRAGRNWTHMLISVPEALRDI
jgi:hypothetical protein